MTRDTGLSGQYHTVLEKRRLHSLSLVHPVRGKTPKPKDTQRVQSHRQRSAVVCQNRHPKAGVARQRKGKEESLHPESKYDVLPNDA